MRQAHRFSGPGQPYEGLTQLTKGGPVWTGKVRTVPELLDAPLRWRKPQRIFVNSMSDLFHDDVSDEFIAAVWWVMTAACHHTYQILTKRAERMQQWVSAHGGQSGWHAACFEKVTGRTAPGERFQDPRSSRHIWLGVSVEDQAAADERIPLLLQTPAAVRWVSYEPALGGVWISKWLKPSCSRHGKLGGDGRCDVCHGRGIWALPPHGPVYIAPILPRIDWLVAGGESGPGARPSHPDWFRSLRDQCAAAGVPYFFKQWGAFKPMATMDALTTPGRGMLIDRFGNTPPISAIGDLAEGKPNPGDFVGRVHMKHVGKRAAGRLLDGRTHDEYPA